jgi:hypothetical protein
MGPDVTYRRILRSAAHVSRVALPAAALLLVLGCSSTKKEPEPTWRSAVVEAPSRGILWDMTVGVLEFSGYPIGTRLDPDSLEAQTGWAVERAPFSGDGVRRRATVRYRPTDEGSWEVDVRVAQQRNVSLRPLQPEYDEWEWTGDDLEAAQLLLARIRANLGPATGSGGR